MSCKRARLLIFSVRIAPGDFYRYWSYTVLPDSEIDGYMTGSYTFVNNEKSIQVQIAPFVLKNPEENRKE